MRKKEVRKFTSYLLALLMIACSLLLNMYGGIVAEKFVSDLKK